MSNKIACSIRDQVSESWSDPLFFNNQASALRAFEDIVNKPDTQYNAHASDYILFQIGVWDETDGTLVGIDQDVIAHAINLLRPDMMQA